MMRCVPIVLIALVFGVGSVEGQVLPSDNDAGAQTNAPGFVLGDQYFGIAAGGYFPLFLIDPNNGSQGNPNQDIGGQVALEWNVYLNRFFSVGVETAYIFANTPNAELLSLWPIAAQISFAPRIGQFLIPVHVDVGMIFSYYDNNTKIDLLLRGGVGFYWFFNPSWGVGLDIDYYFIPQLYIGPTPPPSENRILNSLVGSVGVVYRL